MSRRNPHSIGECLHAYTNTDRLRLLPGAIGYRSAPATREALFPEQFSLTHTQSSHLLPCQGKTVLVLSRELNTSVVLRSSAAPFRGGAPRDRQVLWGSRGSETEPLALALAFISDAGRIHLSLLLCAEGGPGLFGARNGAVGSSLYFSAWIGMALASATIYYLSLGVKE